MAWLTTTTVTGVEMFRKVLDSATAGDNVGLLLKGLSKEQRPRRRPDPGLSDRQRRSGHAGRTSGTSPVSTSSRSGTTAVPVPLSSTAARTGSAGG